MYSERESNIKKAIREYLKWHGWYVINIFQTLGCQPGIADLYAIRNGFSVWIEVKKPGGRQSKVQKEFQRQIEEHGGTYILAGCIEDVEAAGMGVMNCDGRTENNENRGQVSHNWG